MPASTPPRSTSPLPELGGGPLGGGVFVRVGVAVTVGFQPNGVTVGVFVGGTGVKVAVGGGVLVGTGVLVGAAVGIGVPLSGAFSSVTS